jgi:DNA-binding beta-propeller fold protein YncE
MLKTLLLKITVTGQMLHKQCLSIAAALTFGFLASPAHADYHVVASILIGGAGGWDYLEPDPISRRLFVTHQDHVVVLNMDTFKVVGDIPDCPGMGGVALSRELNRGFTANGAEDSVGVFELDTLKPLAKWKATGTRPNQIAFEPATQRVFSFNSTGRNITVFDARSGAVLATIEVDGRTEFYAMDGKGMIYDALLDKSTVIAIDAATMKVVATYSLAPNTEPSGMAMDPRTRRLFVPTHSKSFVVLNADSGKILATLPMGAGNDAAKFDPELQLVFASNGDGTLTILHEDSAEKFSLLKSVKTEAGARTMAVDPQTHRLFLPTADFGTQPTASAQQRSPHGDTIPGTFRVLVLEP